MRWRKNACLLLRIRTNGKIDFVTGLLAVFLASLMMLCCLKISAFMIAGAYVEDALAASNLASALIDTEAYGKNRTLWISDPQGAYEIFKQALSINLSLDEDGRAFQRELLQGPVQIVTYIVYNVEDGHVEQYVLDGQNRMQKYEIGELGEVCTPDGVLIESTTIYSKIQFGVTGWGPLYIQAEKEKSVDVKRNEDE